MDNCLDYIAIDADMLLKFHGKYIFLNHHDQLQLFEIDKVMSTISDKEFSPQELAYVKFRDDCYKETANIDIKPKLFQWYEAQRKAGTSIESLSTTEDYKMVRYYMTINDFQSHFRDFNPQDSQQNTYERDLAEKVLKA